MPPEEQMELTPAERRRERVRHAIIEAAERVFARVGEAGLSIRRLAEEIDYSPAAIYKYFGSKEELLDELKEAFFERLLQRAEVLNQTDMPFEAKSRACMTTYINTALERPHHYMAAFFSVPEPDDCDSPVPWQEFMDSRKGRAFAVLIDMVKDGQAGGHFDPDLDPYLAARSVWASSHGIAHLLIHLPSFPEREPVDRNQSREAYIELHTALVFRSLQKKVKGNALLTLKDRTV